MLPGFRLLPEALFGWLTRLYSPGRNLLVCSVFHIWIEPQLKFFEEKLKSKWNSADKEYIGNFKICSELEWPISDLEVIRYPVYDDIVFK